MNYPAASCEVSLKDTETTLERSKLRGTDPKRDQGNTIKTEKIYKAFYVAYSLVYYFASIVDTRQKEHYKFEISIKEIEARSRRPS